MAPFIFASTGYGEAVSTAMTANAQKEMKGQEC